jgi:dTDP-4-amino-4,6-dideoxygalactose transaminase
MTISQSSDARLGHATLTAPNQPKIPIAGVDREYPALHDKIVPAVTAVLVSTKFILGPEVTAFEAEVGEYLGGVHAVGCANGTDALVLALRALEIGPGDEVIVPAFTFAATAESVVLAGATPVFADIEPDTFAMDPRSAASLVGPRTRALLPVHLFGQCARMEPLVELAERASLRIVEDAAQAIGARWRGKAAGALGHVAGFSFYPTKNLGAPGDGGMVTTTNARIADRLRALRAHGSRQAHVHESIGYNSRLDELHAAVLRVKLPLLDGWNDTRRATARRYRDAIGKGRRIVAPVEIEGAHHVYHHFTVRTSARAELIARLEAEGISSAVYYPKALHEQRAYAKWSRGKLPEAERAATEVLSLPVHPWLVEDEIARIVAALASVS